MIINKIKNLNKKFVNLIAIKLSINYQRSEQIFLSVLQEIKIASSNDPFLVLNDVVNKLMPPLKTKPKKIAGRIYSYQHFSINRLVLL